MKKPPMAPKAAPSEPCLLDAKFVAWTLRMDVKEVFPCGPESNPEADEHLIIWLTRHVTVLAERLDSEDDSSDEFRAYRRRLKLCHDVISGAASAPPEALWEQMASQLGRGVYLSYRAHLRREGER